MTDHNNELAHAGLSRGDQQVVTGIVEVLQGLPQGQIIYWNDPPAVEGQYEGHVDIWAPVVCEPLNLGWAWTIAQNSDSEVQPLDLIVEPDEVASGHPAWKVSTINRVLEAWTMEHAERRDLRFANDLNLVPPLVRRLEDRSGS
jgi:hypothetical protein